MKRIINRVFLFVILAIVSIYPSSIFALIETTSKISIDEKTRLDVGTLSFTNILFKDYSNTSDSSFGLLGEVKNTSSNIVKFKVLINYYDENENSVTATGFEMMAISGTNSFDCMSDLDFLYGHSASEIRYYSLEIEILEDNAIVNNDYNNSLVSTNNSSYEYTIDKYDIDIKVNENNTLDITETITAYFNVPKHGIFRTLPLKNDITRLDGTTSKNRVQITNISVDNEYTTSKENGNLKLKIGSPDHTLTGEQTYTIKYTYNLGKDPSKDYDELYYNIIGTDWDTTIKNISFSITMPKEFDSSKLGFSSGAVGSTDSSGIRYDVIGNTISGSYDSMLSAGEALTVRCELPEEYFVNAGLDFNIMEYFLFFIPIVFLVISYLLWSKFGRDEQVVETVEFYPPKDFNSLEVGFLYKGKATNQDVISLLIYLANKGYLKITEVEKKVLFHTSKDFKITKLKDYDGNDANEEKFFKGLFRKKRFGSSMISKYDSIDGINDKNNDDNIEVTTADLYDNFYITLNKILSSVNSKGNREQIFEKSASNKSIFIILMVIASFCIITIPPVLAYSGAENLLPALLFPGVGFTVLFVMVFGGSQTIYVNGKATNSGIATKIFGLVFGLGFGGFPWVSFVLPTLVQDNIYLIGYIVGLLCILGMIICLKYLPKRTRYGNEMLGKIKGFKNFLETAEKDKLEAMVMENPTYFYDILPYTYVLGVSDKWIKKFETISLQAPDWYDSPSAFDVAAFGTFMNSTMTSATSAMSSSPSSDSGGGSSGGGSSGGGSGGGGGGSW